MKLNFEEIKNITLGAVDVHEENNLILFERFTDEEKELYKNRYEPFYKKCFSTSGIKLMFDTDSTCLSLKVSTEFCESRSYFAFDVTVDGNLIGTINNYSDVDLSGVYCWGNFPVGDFSGEFSLGEGNKRVCIYFPWSVKGMLKELSLDDGSFVKAYKPDKRIMMYGDSITHGYDALNPSLSYAERFCRMMNAEVFNKAIGGETFFPQLAEEKDNINPDLITVAYGTNDWNGNIGYDTYMENCRRFYGNLSANYSDTPIFALTPIWRADYEEEREFGKFENIPECIKKATADIKNVEVIYGFDFVTHDESLYADLRLHPNNEGFEEYANNLYNKISGRIKE